jgi:hypothetical protein
MSLSAIGTGEGELQGLAMTEAVSCPTTTMAAVWSYSTARRGCAPPRSTPERQKGLHAGLDWLDQIFPPGEPETPAKAGDRFLAT